MFNKSQLEAYSNIKAPDELFEKVVSSKPKKSKIYLLPLAASFAACLILIFGIGAFRSGIDSEIFLNGQLVNTDTVMIGELVSESKADMRSLPTLKISVELKLTEKTKVTVSSGVLVLENGERVNSVTFKDDVSFFWEVESKAELTESTMTLKSFSGEQEIVLTQYDDGSYTAEIN